MEYSLECVPLNKNPKLKQLPNGKWEQIWDLVLQTPISQKIDPKDISK